MIRTSPFFNILNATYFPLNIMHFIYYLYTILFGKCNLTNLNTPVYAKTIFNYLPAPWVWQLLYQQHLIYYYHLYPSHRKCPLSKVENCVRLSKRLHMTMGSLFQYKASKNKSKKMI